MKKIRNGWQVAMAVLALGMPWSPASAGLVSLDYTQDSGDNWITRDSDSGLDWLDVPLTANQTYDQARTGPWYRHGFRHATKREVLDLFLHAGLVDDNFDVSVTHPAQALALAALLGPTLVTPNRVSVAGLTGTDFFGRDIAPDFQIGQRFDALLGKVDYIDFQGVLTLGEAHFSGGHPFSDQANEYYGSFLVRPVPEPGTLLLVLVGLLALAIKPR